MYFIILAINCHSLFCLWVVSPLQCRSSILVVILFIYVIYVTNHQNHCKCKMQMSVILCSHGLLDWFNKTILFCVITIYCKCVSTNTYCLLSIVYNTHNTHKHKESKLYTTKGFFSLESLKDRTWGINSNQWD
jgi:hypothetical protein